MRVNKKKLLFKVILLLSLVGLFTQCSNSSNGDTAPRRIRGGTILFHVLVEHGAFDKDIAEQTTHFMFSEDGTYSATLNGKFYQSGDYSYQKIGSEKAKLLLTYSTSETTYNYMIHLTFMTSSSGNWQGYNAGNPGITGTESGTFKIEYE